MALVTMLLTDICLISVKRFSPNAIGLAKPMVAAFALS